MVGLPWLFTVTKSNANATGFSENSKQVVLQFLLPQMLHLVVLVCISLIFPGGNMPVLCSQWRVSCSGKWLVLISLLFVLFLLTYSKAAVCLVSRFLYVLCSMVHTSGNVFPLFQGTYPAQRQWLVCVRRPVGFFIVSYIPLTSGHGHEKGK